MITIEVIEWSCSTNAFPVCIYSTCAHARVCVWQMRTWFCVFVYLKRTGWSSREKGTNEGCLVLLTYIKTAPCPFGERVVHLLSVVSLPRSLTPIRPVHSSTHALLHWHAHSSLGHRHRCCLENYVTGSHGVPESHGTVQIVWREQNKTSRSSVAVNIIASGGAVCYCCCDNVFFVVVFPTRPPFDIKGTTHIV